MASVREYYEGLLKKAGVADDKQQALLGALDDENVSKALNEDLVAPKLRHDDYSRNMDALRDDKKKWSDFYQDTLTWRAQEADRIAQLEALAAGNGHNPSTGNPQGGQQTVLTTEALTELRKEYDARMAQQEQNFMILLEGVGDITGDHLQRFKEKADLGAIKKIAIDKKLSLKQAYDEYTAPRVLAQQQADMEARIKQAREEGAKDALSKHRLPIDAAPREFHPLLDRTAASEAGMPEKGPARDRWIRDQFMNDLNSASSTSGGSTG